MDMRWLTEMDLPQAKQLWKESFMDSDRFIDTYFEYAADINDGLGVFDQDKLLSNLFTLDFISLFASAEYKTPFIAGCATSPIARKQGLMRKLLKATLLAMDNDGVELVFLHPFKHSFYRQFGFETVSYVEPFQEKINKHSATLNTKTSSSLEELPLKELRTAYLKYIRKYDNYFYRTKTRMTTWLRLLLVDGGKITYIQDGDRTAYALYYVEDGVADVFELVFTTDQQRRSLLHSIEAEYAKYHLPEMANHTLKSVEEFTMMRVVNPLRALSKYVYPKDVSFVIFIQDDFLEREYNYSVTVKDGVVDVILSDQTPDISVNIMELASLLSGSYQNEVPKAVADIFPLSSSCYFETY